MSGNRRRNAVALLVVGCLAPIPAPDPAAASTLFGLVSTGELYASTDQGTNWTARSTLPVRDAVGLAAGISTSELYLASGSGVVYRSTDAGMGWTAVGTVAASDVVDLLVHPDLSVMLLTASGTVYRSTDQGASFAALAALTGSDFVSLAVTTPVTKLYALTRTGGVHESTDGGSGWTAKGVFAAPDAVKLRAVGTSLYALAGTGGVYRSTDAAASWTAVGTLSQVGMTGLARDGGTLIASTRAGEVATSGDGASWTWKGAIGQLTVTALGVDTPAPTGVEETISDGPLELAPPWPNPAKLGGELTLRLRLPARGTVTLSLNDVGGRRVAEWTVGAFPAGPVVLKWSPQVRRSGLYFLKIRTAQGATAVRTLTLLR